MLKVSRKLWPVNSMVRPGKVSVMARPSTCPTDRKSTRLNSSHQIISYAVFCLKKKKKEWIYDHAKVTKAIALSTAVLATRAAEERSQRAVRPQDDVATYGSHTVV